METKERNTKEDLHEIVHKSTTVKLAVVMMPAYEMLKISLQNYHLSLNESPWSINAASVDLMYKKNS